MKAIMGRIFFLHRFVKEKGVPERTQFFKLKHNNNIFILLERESRKLETPLLCNVVCISAHSEAAYTNIVELFHIFVFTFPIEHGNRNLEIPDFSSVARFEKKASATW